MEESALKTAELAFADSDFQFIGCFSYFSGRDSEGFGNGQGIGAVDTVFFGCPAQPLFQFSLLFRGNGYLFFAVLHVFFHFSTISLAQERAAATAGKPMVLVSRIMA